MSLSAPERDVLLKRVATRLLDVLVLLERIPVVTKEGPRHWCVCTNCREMETDIERICCRQTPLNCISKMDDAQELSSGKTGIQHIDILWQHGCLGEGNRVVIPSCCMWRIKDAFPDPRRHYTGFRPMRTQ
uniref:P2X purinoreceptor 7 intracellular domain-containing protein n=1 Tax=Labrus bergylta TaxID=56723 RepID=A0A3Q3GQP0_9LABR